MRYAVIFGMILIAVPLLLRIASPEPFPDAASYSQLRTANLHSYDSLYAKPYSPTLSDRLFSIANPQLLLIVLAGITLFCVSMYYSSELFIVLLATTPAFITTFTTASEAAPGIMIISLAALLVSRRQYWAVLFIPLCFAFSFSLGILSAIVLIVAALLAGLPFIALGASFFALVSGSAAALLTSNLDFGFTNVSLSSIVGIVGASNGITVFLVFLSIIGFIMSWVEERKAEQLLGLLIIPCSIFFEHGLLIIAAFLAYYASTALTYLWQREWHFEELKSITLVLIACGLLFSTIIVERSRISVDQERVAATKFISAAYPRGTTIAAGPDLTPILAYYGYVASVPGLPTDPSFAASSLREQGYSLIVDKPGGFVSHFPLVYKGGSYQVYEIP